MKKGILIFFIMTCNICKASTNDPNYSQQWNLQTIHIDTAWQYSVGISAVKVAVLDSGIDYTHPDFGSIYDNTSILCNINGCFGWDFGANTSDIMDYDNHGTAVTSIIASKRNNNIGISGIAGGDGTRNGVKIICCKVPSQPTSTCMSDAIYYAVDNGASIINISLANTPEFDEAIEYAYNRNVVIVAATGNLNNLGNSTPRLLNQICYPASHCDVIAVGAASQDGNVVKNTCYGDDMDLSAPGENIYCAAYNSNYQLVEGTSFAVPQVSGTIALMLSTNNYLLQNKIRNILRETAQKIGNKNNYINGVSPTTGYGILDAGASVKEAYLYKNFKIQNKTYNENCIEQTETIQAGRNINSSQQIGDVVIPTGKSVNYLGHSIHLSPGFHACSGSNFHAKYIENPIWERNNVNTTQRVHQRKLDSIVQEFTYKISPNPATDMITIGGLSEDATYSIYNLTGDKVRETAETTIDISALPAGMYVVIATADGKTYQSKFIKE